jgi:hypothetical protein
MAGVKKISNSSNTNTNNLGIKKISGGGDGGDRILRISCTIYTNDVCPVGQNIGNCATVNWCNFNNGGCASYNYCWKDNSYCMAHTDYCAYQDNTTCEHKTGDICTTSTYDTNAGSQFCPSQSTADTCGQLDYCGYSDAQNNNCVLDSRQGCTNLVSDFYNGCTSPGTNDGMACPTDICYNISTDVP